MKWLPLFVLAAFAPAARAGAAAPLPEERVLASAYLLSTLAEQVAAKAIESFGEVAAAKGPTPREAVAEWKGRTQRRARAELEGRLGADARARYEAFVSGFLAAEQRGDAEALRGLHERCGLRVPPTDYAAFRRTALETWLQGDVAAAGDFLARIEAWVELSKRVPDAPTLDFWLGATSPKAPAAAAAPPAVGALAGAEAAPAAPPPAEDDGGGSALAFFAAARKDKRQQQVEQAQAQMQQLATEREQWEQEWGQKKAERAQAESEAMRRHAEALVQADKDALEQHKNTWAYRMKTIVSSVIGSTIGAFGTPLAQKAGEKAAEALFDVNP